jgi:hypothetical protein
MDADRRRLPAPADAKEGKLVPTRFTPHQRRLGLYWLARIKADLERDADPCPGRLIGSGRGK